MDAKVIEKPREQATLMDVLTNTCFMTMLTMELMLRDVEKRLSREGASIQREKKQNFTRFLENYKRALYFADKLSDTIYEVDAENKWKNIPIWQEESNELARLILLYADKSANVDNANKVFQLLRELPGEGIITEEVLENYYLKKL